MHTDTVTKELQQTTLFDEHDVMSKKRISLHKVAIHNTETGEVQRHQYHMVITDMYMTINIEVSENAIINLVKSLK